MDVALSACGTFDPYYVWQRADMTVFFTPLPILCIKDVLAFVCTPERGRRRGY